MQGMWTNTTLWLPISAAVFAQLLKPFWGWANAGKFDWRTVTNPGGMPSSHSAMVCSLATVLGYQQGLDSPLFGMAVIAALIVMYDARGVRQESGKQARILNQMMRELFSGRPISEEELKELLGHTSTEVVIGAILGIAYSLIYLVWFD
jgi:hypothetical protein